MTAWKLSVLALLPAWMAVRAADGLFGPKTIDLLGHLWMAWNARLGDPTRTTMFGWPGELDLMPVLGGWLDVLLAAQLQAVASPETAYNLVCALYVLVAGLGGAALAASFDVRGWGLVAAGLALQLDGAVLQNVALGRPEQVGLGFVALALAGAVQVCRTPTARWRVACGAAWAALVWASWTYALIVGAALAWWLPWLARSRAAWRGVAGALATALLLAGWHCWSFLSRSLAVRADYTTGSDFADATVAAGSVSLLGWLTPQHAGPLAVGLLALAALVPLRRVRVEVVLGLAFALALALGPDVRLTADGAVLASGPYAWLSGLPVIGWLHWPERLLSLWSCAGAAALGVVVHRARFPELVPVALVAVAGTGAVSAHLHQRWPTPREHLTAPAPFAIVTDGPVLELPLPSHHAKLAGVFERQLLHQQPVLLHPLVPGMAGGDPLPAFRESEVGRWARTLGLGHPLENPDPDWPREAGFRYLALSDAETMSLKNTLAELEAHYGPPSAMGDAWFVWELAP